MYYRVDTEWDAVDWKLGIVQNQNDCIGEVGGSGVGWC